MVVGALYTGGGLSPRVRGNPGRRCPGGSPHGSIPACAGEPVVWRGCRPAGQGLSPRVRGNRPTGISAKAPGGSIPACAGEPPPGVRWWRPLSVYPRVCGGTREGQASAATAGSGLSPRVRGNLRFRAFSIVSRRSIPACAGEPCLSVRKQSGIRVYPRVCGGTKTSLAVCKQAVGLSPRVRGNPPGIVDYVRAGSIPACAGEPA